MQELKPFLQRGTMKHLALMALFLAAAIVLPAPAARGSGIMIKKGLTTCIQDDLDLTCKLKVYVTAPVSYGDQAMLDIQYLDTVTEKGGGETQPLGETLRLVLSKTPPLLRYPLRYLHTVYFYPHEELRLVQNLSPGVQACIDAAGADYPTCGWTLFNESRIEDSQGFCSDRDLDQLQTYHPDLAKWRGEPELGRQSTLEDSFSVAHCLRTGNLQFTGYEIGEYSKDFTITANILKGTALLNQIFLSPAAPVYLLEANQAANGHGIRAQLQNGITAAAGAPDLSNYILYVPTFPPDHPMVVDYKNNMLLVPREMVTADGSECNKVGTDFRAFRPQAANAAKTDAGDCLANQLYHLYDQDLYLLTANPNAETKYLVTGKKMFQGVTAEQAGNELSLIHKSTPLEYSTVRLTLDPAVITEVINEAIGYIKEAWVNTPTSMTRDGKLIAFIKNAGNFQTDYIVSVTDCQPAINNGIPAQALTLNPGEEGTVEFSIDSTLDYDSSHMCVVTLTASSGRKFDFVNVYFDTRKHATQYARDLYLKNAGTQGDGCPDDPDKTKPGVCGCGVPDTDSDGDGVPDCKDNCPNIYNPDQADADTDGVGDVCDGCPNNPLKTDPGQCGCGVPDTDSDGDGVPDCKDNCPNIYNPDQADANENGVGDACDIPTVIQLSSFTATLRAGAVVLNWQTETEIDTIGFNLYRAEAADGEYVKINSSLIPAQGSPTQGATYQFIDEDAKNRRTYWYKLEDIDLNGTSTMHGPVSATATEIRDWGLGMRGSGKSN